MQLKQNKSKRAIEQNLRFSAQRTKHICNNEIEDILKKLKYLSFRDVGSILYVIPKDIQIQGVPKKSTFRMPFEPQCTGSITSSRHPLCLESFWSFFPKTDQAFPSHVQGKI